MAAFNLSKSGKRPTPSCFGSGEHASGTGAAVTGRYLGLHDTATAAVMLTDPKEGTILWAEEAGDRSLLMGAFSPGGPRKVASRMVDRLKDAMKKDRKLQKKEAKQKR